LEKPRWLIIFSVVLVAASYVCYTFSGSDLLPEMDEGGFTIDYITPAGSSLAETNRVVSHVEQMLREVPEVESTSRRTGLQLGLAAVTEANTGDILVKLKAKRDRGIDEIMADIRADIKKEEPSLDVDFIQVLQDMIGDLTSAPQPIEIKLFSQDPKQLEEWAPKVGEAITKIKGVVDLLNGIDNTISGPAVTFQGTPAWRPARDLLPRRLRSTLPRSWRASLRPHRWLRMSALIRCGFAFRRRTGPRWRPCATHYWSAAVGIRLRWERWRPWWKIPGRLR
jgi:multidrug efflux pump subunit AcrB